MGACIMCASVYCDTRVVYMCRRPVPPVRSSKWSWWIGWRICCSFLMCFFPARMAAALYRLVRSRHWTISQFNSIFVSIFRIQAVNYSTACHAIRNPLRDAELHKASYTGLFCLYSATCLQLLSLCKRFGRQYNVIYEWRSSSPKDVTRFVINCIQLLYLCFFRYIGLLCRLLISD